MRTIFKLAATAAVALGLSTGASVAADPLKVGFIYVGPVSDHGWSYQHDQGRLALEKHFGDKVETTYIESVPEGADAERAIERLARSGHDLIFTTSFGYMNPTLKVARKFPKVKFEHATGYKQGRTLPLMALVSMKGVILSVRLRPRSPRPVLPVTSGLSRS